MVEWGDLPFEVQEMIVQRSTNYTRKAMRACSLNTKKLIEEETKLNSVYIFLVTYKKEEEKWLINVHKVNNTYNYLAPSVYWCDSFVEFQEKVRSILAAVHCIATLVIHKLNTDILLNILPTELQTKLRVEKVIIQDENRGQIENILSQLEPVYLREITMKSDGGNVALYDMQQVRSAESLIVEGLASIREDQLLKLEAQNVSFEEVTCSANQYIKKCALQASVVLPQFRFGGLKAFTDARRNWFPPLFKKILLRTDDSKLKLKVAAKIKKRFDEDFEQHVVKGGICFHDEVTASLFSQRDASELRKIKKLFIHYREEIKRLVNKFKYPKTSNFFSFLPQEYVKHRWWIRVERENHSEQKYELSSFEEVQKKIDEVLVNTDHIGELDLNLKSLKKPMRWLARDKKLTVSRINVEGDHSITGLNELLHQIDPVFVKVICIYSNEVDSNLFNIPHVSYAAQVIIYGSILHDDQLLRMQSQYFTSVGYHGQNVLLTAKAINQYMKYCLLDSTVKWHSFVLRHLSENLNMEELFEGFLIEDSNHHKYITVADSEYKLRITYRRSRDMKSLEGVTERRDWEQI